MEDPLADLARLEGVPSAVVAARDACDVVLRDRGLRQIPADDSARALLAAASASVDATADPDRFRPGAVRLSTQLIELGGLVLTAPGQALARCHTLLAHGLVDTADLGRLLDEPGVGERMAALNRLISTPTEASPVVLAAVVHAELATVAPFGFGPTGRSDGNQVLARAAEHLVLIGSGIDPRGVIVCEAGHHAAGRFYAEALDGYRAGTPTGLREWILHCAQALTYGAEVSPLAGRGAKLPRGGTDRVPHMDATPD